MTIAEARQHVGRVVVYLPSRTHGQLESGVITSANDWYVFVRYGADKHSKATKASDLELETGGDAAANGGNR